jgi:hypothetical protein
MARKKKAEPVSIDELKSYVKGAIELNDDGWHPDAKQWNKIVDMIMNVKEPEPAPAAPAPHYGPPAQQGTAMQPAGNLGGMPPQPQPGQGLPTGMGGAVPKNPYEMDDPNVDRPAPMKLPSDGAPVPKFLRTGVEQRDENGNISSGITVKTPNIDTSQKQYKSGYE